MTERDWTDSQRVIGMFLNGEAIEDPDARGRRVLDESFVLLFNANHEDCAFTLPNRRFAERWSLVIDTAAPEAEPGSLRVEARNEIHVAARSVILLRRDT